MRTSYLVLATAILACVPAGHAQTKPTTLLGIYYGNQGWDMEQVRVLDSWLGKPHAVVVVFTNWDDSAKTIDNLFQQQLPAVWTNANVPLITWEPYVRGTTPADVARRIGDGVYDAYVVRWASRLKTYLAGNDGLFNTPDDRRAYIRLAHEMNGNWYPWSANGDTKPADYVRMWQRVHTQFDALDLGPEHVQWVWSVNHRDVGAYSAESYYPGDTWVDWIGMDGYNWGSSQPWSSWTSPQGVFQDMAVRLRALSTRPLAITEVATTTAGADVAAKNEWTRDLYAWAAQAGIAMVCYFNEDKETNWAVFAGATGDGVYIVKRARYQTFSAYSEIAARPTSRLSTPQNLRLLTNDEFAGALEPRVLTPAAGR